MSLWIPKQQYGIHINTIHPFILLRVFKHFPLLKLKMVLLITLAQFFRKLHCNMPGTFDLKCQKV